MGQNGAVAQGQGVWHLGPETLPSAVEDWIESFPQNHSSQSGKETCSMKVNQHNTELLRTRANILGGFEVT